MRGRSIFGRHAVIEFSLAFVYGPDMMLSVRLFSSTLFLLAGLLANGCFPSPQSQLDEQREPHFLAGKSRISTLDYTGAVECFEKALEVNPQSASAHFELACVFDQKEADAAAAIYHYDHYLKLRPDAGNAEVVKQRILTCKQELARTVSLGPITEKVQKEFDHLALENKKLSDENKQLRETLDRWIAYAGSLQTLTNRTLPYSRPTPTAPPSSALRSG